MIYYRCEKHILIFIRTITSKLFEAKIHPLIIIHDVLHACMIAMHELDQTGRQTYMWS